jgi:hypothetical protein
MGSKWGDFLKEKPGGGRFNRLRNWREAGEVVVWIHTNTQIHKRLFHMIPFVGEKEDEQTGSKRTQIMYLPFVCHETVQDYMNREPAKRCPLCRFIEHLRTNGNIPDHETVWDSSIGDRKRDRICTKADFTGDTEGGGDWRLSFKPALQYVLAVIDNDNPGEGIRIATEKFSLGESIKKAVQQEIDRKGPELGDPDQNPYAFKWVFNSNARQPADYYTAYPFDRAQLTEEIQELLDKPEENLDAWISPGDTKKLREAMEAHVTVDDVDFDILFDNVLENAGTSAEQAEPAPEEKDEPKEKKEPAKRTRQAAPPKEKPAKEPEPEPEAEESTVPMMECPSCRGKGQKRGKDCKVCDGTGEVEAPDDEEEEAAPEPEPEPPKKSPPKKTRKAAAPPPEPEPEPEEEEDVAEVAAARTCP